MGLADACMEVAMNVAVGRSGDDVLGLVTNLAVYA